MLSKPVRSVVIGAWGLELEVLLLLLSVSTISQSYLSNAPSPFSPYNIRMTTSHLQGERKWTSRTCSSSVPSQTKRNKIMGWTTYLQTSPWRYLSIFLSPPLIKLMFFFFFFFSFYVTTEVVWKRSLRSPHAEGRLCSVVEGPVCIVVSSSPLLPAPHLLSSFALSSYFPLPLLIFFTGPTSLTSYVFMFITNVHL